MEDKNEISDKQLVEELCIRNDYLRKKIHELDKLKREYRDEIFKNNDIMSLRCKHEWVLEERTSMYEKLYHICKICGSVR